ncbi:MAG: iron ABC transporter permease [Candidatus Pacebacteria bacterium]|nr:iron ABC transporter permease [Candidatus Paceibacterota bacterium]
MNILRWDGVLVKILMLGFLLIFILFPSSFVLIFLFKHSREVVGFFSESSRIFLVTEALVFSLKIALTVASVDLVFGLPFAWLLAKERLPASRLLENITSLPLALPTSALGFSAAVFWTFSKIPLSAFWFLVLVHLSFTFPFVVGILTPALKRGTGSLEQAATILGAPKLTVIRTIVLPQIKLELTTAVFFSFARSLSETGATIVALTVFGLSQATAPVLISQFSNGGEGQISYNERLLLAALISGVLILISLTLFSIVQLLVGKRSLPVFSKLVSFEAGMDSVLLKRVKNFFLFGFLVFIILIPPFFILNQVLKVQTLNIRLLMTYLFNSLLIAFSTILINLIIGTPMAYFLAHTNSRKLKRLMNFLVDIPLVVPTVALGFSLALYWRGQTLISSDLPLVILAHLTFTYPYAVRTLCDAFTGLSQEFIDAARSFGASPIMVLRSVVLPLLSPSFATAAVLVVARSLGETGATMAVSSEVITAPVYIVDLVNEYQIRQAGIASALLITLSFGVFALLRRSAFARR